MVELHLSLFLISLFFLNCTPSAGNNELKALMMELLIWSLQSAIFNNSGICYMCRYTLNDSEVNMRHSEIRPGLKLLIR